MHNSWFLDDETISVQLGNISTRIRQRDFVDFIGIQPNLAFTTLEYGGGKALLQTERNWKRGIMRNEQSMDIRDYKQIQDKQLASQGCGWMFRVWRGTARRRQPHTCVTMVWREPYEHKQPTTWITRSRLRTDGINFGRFCLSSRSFRLLTTTDVTLDQRHQYPLHNWQERLKSGNKRHGETHTHGRWSISVSSMWRRWIENGALTFT